MSQLARVHTNPDSPDLRHWIVLPVEESQTHTAPQDLATDWQDLMLGALQPRFRNTLSGDTDAVARKIADPENEQLVAAQQQKMTAAQEQKDVVYVQAQLWRPDTALEDGKVIGVAKARVVDLSGRGPLWQMFSPGGKVVDVSDVYTRNGYSTRTSKGVGRTSILGAMRALQASYPEDITKFKTTVYDWQPTPRVARIVSEAGFRLAKKPWNTDVDDQLKQYLYKGLAFGEFLDIMQKATAHLKSTA